jgi:hypothetical protein
LVDGPVQYVQIVYGDARNRPGHRYLLTTESRFPSAAAAQALKQPGPDSLSAPR